MFFLTIVLMGMLSRFCSDEIVWKERSFVIDHINDVFLKDGEPFQVLSGAIHYFRVEKERWAYILDQAKVHGLNAVETYIPWSIHEPQYRKYDFTGRNDFLKFVDLAKEANLLVIARVGPYSCAEMDKGGLPAWLPQNSHDIRSNDTSYMKEVKTWLDVILPMLIPYLYNNGGPIIMVQMENEYGGYAVCIHDYMEKLEKMFRKHVKYDVILFTVDGCVDNKLKCGGLPSVFHTVDFGYSFNVDECVKSFRKVQPTGPMFVMEYYTGWFTFWGNDVKSVDPVPIKSTLENILSHGHSVNLYMFMGGTNYGWLNTGGYGGGSFYFSYITSYEYDGPLTEAGNYRPKFFYFRETLRKYNKNKLPGLLPTIESMKYSDIKFTRSVNFLDTIPFLGDSIKKYNHTASMEELGYYSGFVLYSTNLTGNDGILTLDTVHDFALVFMNHTYVGWLSSSLFMHELLLKKSYTTTLHILLYNEGRSNAGGYVLADSKCIKGVKIDNKPLYDWQITTLLQSSEKISRLSDVLNSTGIQTERTGFYFSYVELKRESISDTYIHLSGFTKGIIYVNGNNIARYDYTKGPQASFFCPKSYFKEGKNEIVIFELILSHCGTLFDCSMNFVKNLMWM